MDTTDIKPGFVRLFCHDSARFPAFISSAIVKTNNGFLLSSLKYRDLVVDLIQKVFPTSVAHGPCSTFKLPLKMEFDLLACFSCKTWPVVANEWVVRYRKNNWPPRDLISDIIRDGCLVVPIGNPHSKESHIQWRISFSMAEKKLIHSMNHTQFLCYGLMKLYLKHVINSNAEVKDLICSYFLKTCLFYCIEEEHISWDKESFLDCFWTCFRRLIKLVKNEYCPNFFIKENKMFEGKVCGEKSGILLSYLTELYHEGLYSLSRIPCLSELLLCNMYGTVLTGNTLTDAEREFICDVEISPCLEKGCETKDGIECLRLLTAIADMVQKSTRKIDKAMLTIRYHLTVYYFVQLVYQQICTNESNKNNYKYMKQIESLIVHNCMSINKCNGMLLLVTLRYLMRKYKKVVKIVQKVVKKLKCSIIYKGITYTCVYNKQVYMNEKCVKGLTLYQKLNCDIFASTYCCLVDCKLYPSEIEQELLQHSIRDITFINPMLYSYVLMFLSYLHMESKQNMIDTLSELFTTIYDIYDKDRKDKVEAQLALSLFKKCIQLFESWHDNNATNKQKFKR
ncbi:hypothetical protein KUTeg_011062 [Tegillarca granosa]|uniref:Mab-21-like HhH/H2TH-like domain-containing protein n=1 Tax=Tegillarca granosa TaxID=220873 RepID=A0ABQ9F2U4_TEGGR|nr:hypothetical protein KUTeg_011062 [Tegillarca granosa]